MLSNKHDVIHPIEYSLFYKRNIGNSSYYELTSKTVNAETHKLAILISKKRRIEVSIAMRKTIF